jgi:adenylate cyclase
MQSSKHVFISFKSEERNEAYRFSEALKSAGYQVWWAENLQCGQEWHGEIDKAIEDAGAIIVLWSKNSYVSPWVKARSLTGNGKENLCSGTYRANKY